MKRFPRSSSNGEPNANPSMQAFPKQTLPPIRQRCRTQRHSNHPANAANATIPAQNPDMRARVPSAARVDIIQQNRRNAGNGPKYMRVLPSTIESLTDNRVQVDAYVAMQKMFGLRIIRPAEHLADKDLVATGGGEYPQNHSQNSEPPVEVRPCDSLLPF